MTGLTDYLYKTTVHNTDGLDGVAYVEGDRGLAVVTSNPLKDTPGTNPEELFGLSITTCLNATIQSLLRGRGYTYKSRVSADVEMRRESKEVGYYFQVTITASIEELDLSEAERLIDAAEKRCPVAKLTKGSSTVTVQTVPYTS